MASKVAAGFSGNVNTHLSSGSTGLFLMGAGRGKGRQRQRGRQIRSHQEFRFFV
jgi:hypothetical protein